MTYIIPEVRDISAGATEVVSVDCIDFLDSGELLTGTPTITEDTTTDLTLSNKVVSTTALTINDRTVAIGKAVQFKVTGQVAGVTYLVFVTCSTDATIARVAKFGLKMRCV